MKTGENIYCHFSIILQKGEQTIPDDPLRYDSLTADSVGGGGGAAEK